MLAIVTGARWRWWLGAVLSTALIAGCTVSPAELSLSPTDATSVRPTEVPATPVQPAQVPQAVVPAPTVDAPTTPRPTPDIDGGQLSLHPVHQAFSRTMRQAEIGFEYEVGFGFRAASGRLSSADVLWSGTATYPGPEGWVVMNRGDFGDSHETPEGASDALGQIDAEIWENEEVDPVDIRLLLQHLEGSMLSADQSLKRDDGSAHWWVTSSVEAALPVLRGQLGTVGELAALEATTGAQVVVDVGITADGTIETLVISLDDWWQEAATELGVRQDQWVHVSIELKSSGLSPTDNECPDAEASKQLDRYCEFVRSRSV